MQLFQKIRTVPRHLLVLGTVASLAVAGLSIFGVSAALAAPKTDVATSCARTDVQCVIAFGNQIIDDRTAKLTKLNDKANQQVAAGHITNTQASAIQADVSSNQSGLSALRSKLDAETDAADARQDVRNVYSQFRIYAVVLPRDYHEIELDIMSNIQAKLQGLEPTLQQAINNAPASEQAQLNSLYSDFTAKVSAASTQITTANSQVSYFTPTNFDNSPSTYKVNWLSFRSAILAGRSDLRAAANDLHQMSQILKTGITPAAGS